MRITWSTPIGELVALAPSDAELAQHAVALSAGYNDPRNAPLLGHTEDIAPDEIAGIYASLREAGTPFLFFLDGAFVGDGDLRGSAPAWRELAYLVASPAMQGKGLGTRYATMLLAYAFRALQCERVYAAIVPENHASRRVFDKLGFVVVTDAPAEVGDDGDIVLAITREVFAGGAGIAIG